MFKIRSADGRYRRTLIVKQPVFSEVPSTSTGRRFLSCKLTSFFKFIGDLRIERIVRLGPRDERLIPTHPAARLAALAREMLKATDQ